MPAPLHPPDLRLPKGFALVATMAIMAMVVLVLVGLLGMSMSAQRRATYDRTIEQARVNALLGLSMAMGELQKQMGPDQRVSAAASILESTGNIPAHPHWTGVWATTWNDGSAVLERDATDGSLRDKRTEDYDRTKAVRAWLVSGQAPDPMSADIPDAVTLVGPGTVGADPTLQVSASRIPTPPPTASSGAGHFAWWIGDEGIKANLATMDAHEGKKPVPAQAASGGYNAILANQSADSTPLLTGPGGPNSNLPSAIRSRLATTGSLPLAGALKPEAFHQITTWSLGVLANVRDGRLKRDLSAWLDGPDEIPSLGPNAPGLATNDNLVGPANADVAAISGVDWSTNRYRDSSPKFGVMKSWAKATARFDGANTPTSLPTTKSIISPVPKDAALANLQSVALDIADLHALLPVLVEGSYYSQLSWYRVPVTDPTNPPAQPYQFRIHIYPRVVLWNPYNVSLRLPRTMVMIQGNGRTEMKTLDYLVRPDGRKSYYQSQWLFYNGGRSMNFSDPGGFLQSEGFNGPHMGSYLFSLEETLMEPGECLVFSPVQSAEYNGPAADGSNRPFDLSANLLSSKVAPDPSLGYYISFFPIGRQPTLIPQSFWVAPSIWDVKFQGDDCRVLWKHLGNQSGIDFDKFDQLPQLAIISANLQYGAGREPRIAWDNLNKVPVEETASAPPVLPTLAPDVRTRQGVRLRWHQEHLSNELASGPLAGTPYLQEAALANWNPRASFAFRSPWDNIGGNLPKAGNLGGPWFFGLYTRDLYDQDVSWSSQMPVSRNGKQHGNPFGPPQESTGNHVIFDVPRKETGVLSIGQFMHAKTSEFVWHPSMAIGQSLSDPRLSAGQLLGLDRTVPTPVDAAEAANGGFLPDNIGWSNDALRGDSRESWSDQAKLIFQSLPQNSNLVYDLSFELNHTLWDDYFLSTGDRARWPKWLQAPLANPLPNGRMRLNPWTRHRSTSGLADLHRAASHLMLDGAFNVNSTSVEAWKAMLGSTRHLGFGIPGAAVFPRFLSPPGGEWNSSLNPDDHALWSGFRSLTEDELDRLAREIVVQVKARGPFLSLSDFVNRRLANNESGRLGPLQAAIEAAGLNDSMAATHALDNTTALIDYTHPDNIRDATRLEQTLKPSTTAWGAPGHLTQGDILQVLGSTLSARSDTFVIRTYGDVTDSNGRVAVRQWCEAIVQRLPEPVQADDTGLNPATPGQAGDFGRRFVIRSFRWLDADEV